MTKTTTYSGEIRCEHNGEQIGWVYRAGDGRWVAKLNGENDGGRPRIIGRHVSRERAIARIAEFNGIA